LQDKLIVISGASKGVGRQLAYSLAGSGARLVLIARSAELLSGLEQDLQSKGCECRGFACDLAQTDSLLACVERIHRDMGKVDILINNAGIGYYKPFLEHSVQEHMGIIDLNLKALVFLTQAILPDMLEKGSGHIVNIGSDLADRPLGNMAVYTATKHAVRGFSLSLMREVKDRGVKVSLINPGMIDTSFHGGQEGELDAKGALQADQLSQAILQVLTQPGYQMVDEITIHAMGQDY
jgi:short-subunit dehydrogenase